MGFLGEKVRAEIASSGGLESSNWDAVCGVRSEAEATGGDGDERAMG